MANETAAMERRAECLCGELRVICTGEPARVSMCHCLECQRRTGSVFGVQARYPRERVKVEGASAQFAREADSGNRLTFHFCRNCGTTVYWEGQGFPDLYAVAVGTFADPNFPAPKIAVWESRRHDWTEFPEMPITRSDRQI